MNKSELVRKFLDNGCSAEEAQLAMQYLIEEPYLLDELLEKSEWDNTDGAEPLHPELENDIRRKVLAQIGYRRRVRVIRIVSVAASVAVIVFLSAIFFNRTTPVNVPAQLSEIKATPRIERIENSTKDNRQIVLPDHSVVALFPASSIEFEQNFASGRNITLEGKALFDVKENPHQPFTVFSETVATTALGTRFTVDNSSDPDKINVKLYEGKVVVRPAHELLTVDETFLSPGQQCFVDLKRNSVVVQTMFDRKAIAKRVIKKPTETIRDISIDEAPLSLDFRKTPLATVFGRLENVFGRKILFSEKDVKDDFFTGSFEIKDSLHAILKVITNMNGLKIDEKGKVIKISRQEKSGGTKLRKRAQLVYPDINSRNVSYYFGETDHTTLLETVTSRQSLQPLQEVQTGDILRNGDEYRFRNVPLVIVFEKMDDGGGRPIQFSREDLAGKYFTGRVVMNETMVDMLYIICRMNGLKLKRVNGGYVVNK